MVLSDGGYAIMDRLAEQSGQGKQPWASFSEVSVARIAAGPGCPVQRISDHTELTTTLADHLPGAGRAHRCSTTRATAVDPPYG